MNFSWIQNILTLKMYVNIILKTSNFHYFSVLLLFILQGGFGFSKDVSRSYETYNVSMSHNIDILPPNINICKGILICYCKISIFVKEY